MIEQAVTGIVLRRRWFVDDKISLFTDGYGRLQGLSCNINRSVSCWELSDPSIVWTPCSGVHTTFYWQQHFLELYYYFLPLEQPSEELFSLLSVLIHVAKAPALFWRGGVGCFFQMLGYQLSTELESLVTSFTKVCNYYWHKVQENNDNVLQIPMENDCYYDVFDLDSSIMSLLKRHPYYHMLKTIPFIPEFSSSSVVVQ